MCWRQVEVAVDECRFGQYCQTEAVPVDNFKTLAGEPELCLQREVRVAHRAGADHGWFAATGELSVENLRRIALDFNVFKVALKLIAVATTIAVDAAVRTAPIEVHAAFGGQNSLVVPIVVAMAGGGLWLALRSIVLHGSMIPRGGAGGARCGRGGGVAADAPVR